MSTPTLLLVDGDPHSRRLMEVSLRKAGYQVVTAPDGETALGLDLALDLDLIISDTELPGLDGFALRREVLGRPRWANVPFVFLTREGRLEDRRRGLELGVEEYLTRPIFVKEVVARVQILLQRQVASASTPLPAVPVEGTLDDLGLVDLLQTMQQVRASGVVYLDREEFRGRVYVRQGRVIDARVGRLDGEEAFFRLVRWPEGSYTVDLRELHQRPRIQGELNELLDQGLALLDECATLQTRLPRADPVLRVDLPRLARDLDRIPAQVGDVLRLFDGLRTVSRVLEDSPFADLETLRATVRLFEQGLLIPLGTEAEDDKRSLSEELSQWLETVEEDSSTQDRRSGTTAPLQAAAVEKGYPRRVVMADSGPGRAGLGSLTADLALDGEEGELRTGTTQVWPLRDLGPGRPGRASPGTAGPATDDPALAAESLLLALARQPEPSRGAAPSPAPAAAPLPAASPLPAPARPRREEEGFLEIFTMPAPPAERVLARLATPALTSLGPAPDDESRAPTPAVAVSLERTASEARALDALGEPLFDGRARSRDELRNLSAELDGEQFLSELSFAEPAAAAPAGSSGPAGAGGTPTDPGAAALGALPSMAWLDEQIQLRVSRELARRAEQQAAGLAQEERGREEQAARQQLAAQARDEIAAETRRLQEAALLSTLRDQERAAATPTPDSAEEQQEQRRRQATLESRRRALEEARRHSEAILLRAQEEARQAEQELRQAAVEEQQAADEAVFADQLRSEIEQTQSQAREEAEALRAQAQRARREAEERRGRASAERQRTQERAAAVAPLADEAGAAPPSPGEAGPVADGAAAEQPGAAKPAAIDASRMADEPRRPGLVVDASLLGERPPQPAEQSPAAVEDTFFSPAPADTPADPSDDELLAGAMPAERGAPWGMIAALVGLLLLLGVAGGFLLHWHSKAAPAPLKLAQATPPMPPRLELAAGVGAPRLLAAAAQPDGTDSGLGQATGSGTPAPTTPVLAGSVTGQPEAGTTPGLKAGSAATAQPDGARAASGDDPAGGTGPGSAGVRAAAAGDAAGAVAGGTPAAEPGASATPDQPGAEAAAALSAAAEAAIKAQPGVPGAPAGGTPAATKPSASGAAPAEAKPANPRALYAAAERLRQAGRDEEAVKQYQAALAKMPGDERTLIGLGNALYELRRPGEALRYFREAVRVNPRSADGHVGLGMCHQDQGQRDEARRAYQKFLQLAPRHRFAHDVRLVLEQQLK